MNYLETYRHSAITTQSPGQVVVLLYEGAIRFLRQAQLAVASQNYARKSNSIARAQDIIFELNASLNIDAGGEIANNLRSLYAFMWTQLSRVNTHNDNHLLSRIIGILEDLSGAWKQTAGK